MAESKPQKPEETAMAEESKSKQQKPNEDRISSLPEPLLIHILSLLSSKTSVQTCILSTRWRNLWKHVPVLNLSDDDFIKFNSERFKQFRNFFYFVNSLIYVLRPHQVHKIRLSSLGLLLKLKCFFLSTSPLVMLWLLGDVPHLHFPNFGHLLHLNLNLVRFNANSLMSLLQKCHSLEVLLIQNDKEVCIDKEEQSSLPKWTAQPNVPSCLESHLSFIQFKGYRGFIDELFFAEYILQNGRVLKTIIIVDISAHLKEKFDHLKRLSNVPRASRMCQLTFG